jgi:hypothetical protein
MTNRPKQIGTGFETAVVDYLKQHGYPLAERRTLSGTHDRGDVAGVPGWVLECKAEKSIDLAGYMGEVATELGNCTLSTWGAAVVKRRQKSAAEAYFVMPLNQAVALMRHVARLEAALDSITGLDKYNAEVVAADRPDGP